jgi:hypothetical protein
VKDCTGKDATGGIQVGRERDREQDHRLETTGDIEISSDCEFAGKQLEVNLSCEPNTALTNLVTGQSERPRNQMHHSVPNASSAAALVLDEREAEACFREMQSMEIATWEIGSNAAQEQSRNMTSTQSKKLNPVTSQPTIECSIVYGSGFGINEQTEDNKGKSGHGGLFEMLTELGLADQYLHRLESEEMDMVTLQETMSISGSLTLLQVLEDAGVDKAGPRTKIVNFLQSLCVS